MDYFTNNEDNNFDNGLENDLEQEILREEEPSNKKPSTKFGLGVIVGILIAIAIALISMVVFVLVRQTTTSEVNASDKINTILEYLDRYFLYDFDEEIVENGLAKGLLEGLGDKYACYYTTEEFNELMEENSGEYYGIGVSVTQLEDGSYQIYKVFDNTPAKEAGLQAKDFIVSANGESDFKDLDALVAVVRGAEGTFVDLEIKRGEEIFPVKVERRKVFTETVTYRMLDNNIGYIEISQFETTTAEQFNNAIDSLNAQGMAKVIMDLRDNPGGDYDTVVAMADRVLPKGKILTTRDKNNREKTETSDEEHQLHIPMVLLVNGNSASASELFTGAIQDYDWATIVGTQSFGKGIVQSIFRLPDGSGIKFTTEKYFTPKDRDINGVGITPDVVIDIPEDAYKDGLVTEDEDTQLQKAIEILNESAN